MLIIGGPASSGVEKPLVDVRDHGATGDGTTDDTAAVTAAIAEVAARAVVHDTGGAVYLPFGQYRCTQQLTIPKNIYLVGESAYASKLILDTATGIDRFLEFGAAGEIATYSGIKSLQVDAGGHADVAVYLYGPQEGSAVSESWVIGGLISGIEVDTTGVVGTSNKFVIDRTWCWTIGDAATAGFKVTGGVLTVRSSTFVGNNRTVAAPSSSAGILATDATVVVEDVNCEFWESGFSLTRSSADIHGASAFSVTTGLRCSADNTDYPVFLTNAKWDCTGSDIVDTGTGVTLATASSYMSAGRAAADPKHYRREWVDHDAIRIMRAGTSTYYSLWVDSSGRLRIKSGDKASDTDGTVVGAQS